MPTFSAVPEPDNYPPRTLLTLDWPGQTEAVITRQDPDGRSRPVRLADPAHLSGGVWVGYDYESWLNQSSYYVATTAEGEWDTPSVMVTADRPWLRHPGIPSLSLPVEPIGPLADRVRRAQRAVLEPIGRRYPIVVSDGRRKSISSTLLLRTETLVEAQAIVAIMDDATPLLLDVAEDYGLGIAHEYLSFGDLTEVAFQADYGPDQWRTWSASYIVVGQPPGGIQAQRTYADVLTQWSTYQDLLTNYDTYVDLLTGTTS